MKAVICVCERRAACATYEPPRTGLKPNEGTVALEPWLRLRTLPDLDRVTRGDDYQDPIGPSDAVETLGKRPIKTLGKDR